MPPRHTRPVPHARGHVTPVHRGPQAASVPASVALPLHAPNAALLIDFDNVTMGIRSDLASELKMLLSSDIVRGKVSVQRAYADWRRYPQYIVPLTESSIDLIFAPAYGSSKKNATDIRLAIDALELVFTRPEIGTFILLSGDSDFSSLVLKLKEYGKYVIGVGIRESASDLLVQNCDEYYSYNTLAGLVNTRDEEVVKWDPWELATEAVQRMKRNGDVMRADRLKQVMQQIDSSFDEKNLGMSKFSRFVTEAAHRGIIALHKMENGQYEVGVPQGDGETPKSEPRHAKHAEPRGETKHAESKSGEGDDRRRGRRGRGRGRDRDERPRDIAAAAEPSLAAPSDTVPSEAPSETSSRGPRNARGTRGARADRAERAEQLEITTEPLVEVKAPASAADPIGASGMRLTRDEAFDLVRRAVAAAAPGDRPVRASEVRLVARELLGRDSESLNERNFFRILQDAHDADIVDLRRRGDDYDVAPAVAASSIADQLDEAEKAHAPAPKAPRAAMPRGMGPRGVASRGRGLSGKAASLPIDLLSIGVVDEVPTVAAVAPLAASTPSSSANNGQVAEAPAKGTRGRKTAAKKATSKTAAKTARPAAKATAATRDAGKAAPAKKTAGRKKTT